MSVDSAFLAETTSDELVEISSGGKTYVVPRALAEEVPEATPGCCCPARAFESSCIEQGAEAQASTPALRSFERLARLEKRPSSSRPRPSSASRLGGFDGHGRTGNASTTDRPGVVGRDGPALLGRA